MNGGSLRLRKRRTKGKGGREQGKEPAEGAGERERARVKGGMATLGGKERKANFYFKLQGYLFGDFTLEDLQRLRQQISLSLSLSLSLGKLDIGPFRGEYGYGR